ncbi:MAG: DUF6491 family protein [Steroidobacteraceae bacterium]|nr:DUF6491 family protein [Steroidobacteraceae bacterium]MDW8260552.1 DUF6491 family protein [Gammaproteobacteria bacterium]
MKTLRLIPIFALALLTSACASTIGQMRGESPSERYRQYAGEPIERFTAFDITGWTPVSRNELVVWTGVNDAYLVKVWDTCRDLQFAERIGVTRTANSVSKFESVRVGRDRCPINEIRPIDVKQMKADRAAATAVGSGPRD